MASRPQASPSWEELPTEIWLMIFRAIPDIPTLKALAFISSALRKIFITNASSISFAVLSNEIPAAILPEAVAAWSSSNVKPWSKLGVRDFLEQYHADRETLVGQSWTISKAREVSQLHQRCRFFAAEFVESVFPTNPTFGTPIPAFSPSRLELNRIERTFHRFELYCNLFRIQFESQEEAQRFSVAEQQEIYFKHYACWETEQLACVYDYLFRRLSVPFNDVALHDVR